MEVVEGRASALCGGLARELQRSNPMTIERHTQLRKVADQRRTMMQIVRKAVVRDVVASVPVGVIDVAEVQSRSSPFHRAQQGWSWKARPTSLAGVIKRFEHRLV